MTEAMNPLNCIFGAAIVATLATAAAPALSDTYVASWNVKHLGWDNGKDIRAVAEVAGAFDLIALQEVMSLDGLEKLEWELEQRTGAEWQTMASEAIGRGSYREHYAFAWRTDEVEWVDGAVVYIDDRDSFAREPFSMRFETAEGYRFVMASAHLIYGDSAAEREREARALNSYHAWLEESFAGTPIYIAGDFNLPPGNAAWDPLGQTTAPLITKGATTLSPVNGRFANLYDNIWAPAGIEIPVVSAGIMNFPAELGITHEVARATVSDHAPVWMLIDPDASPVVLLPHAGSRAVSSATGAFQFDEPQIGVDVRGNRKSMIYHIEGCPGFDKMSEKNIVHFTSQELAISAGFRIARNCS
ncbi:endonuclease/exonuclease/phosphatase family protein [Leisingera sp. XS_AS12]|uniref:endonuclease/exonuclease/phosphatase family protein n=1 Tax=Leisingera sp. XS_AS12 TaxID=3241294 RepID=UPI0035124DDA